MKRKWMLTIALGMALCLLGGWILGTAGKDARAQDYFWKDSPASGDTVTISREEYERYRQLDELLELKEIVEQYYYQEPSEKDLLEGAAAGLLAGLKDPYSFYYTPENWTKMWEDDQGEYAGVGILISSNYKTNLCTISRVFKGSPAEAAGVQRGDILYRVGEDLLVAPANLQDAVDIMRGTPGTSVDITFLRKGEEITFTMNRANIVVNQVESTMLTEDIGLIALYEFAGKSDQEFLDAFEELLRKGMKGLLIDLRDNPGGWVNSAQTIADLFVDEGDLCYLLYRGGEESHEYLTQKGKIEMPIVMLVNENSASASEILTGCLRERAGATVVGVQTYGKGVVQAVLPSGTEGAGFQLTVAEYLTPLGNHVHETGLTPDVEAVLPEDDPGGYDFADAENDPQLKTALETLQKKMGAGKKGSV